MLTTILFTVVLPTTIGACGLVLYALTVDKGGLA